MNTTRLLIIEAKRFARAVHADFFLDTISGDRKPQLEHLQEVADLVWASGGTDTEIAAAWLHDSIEDTPTTLRDIEKLFGQSVAEIVDNLTDSDEMKALPTIERKTKQAEKVRYASNSVKMIKLADQISNIRLMALDPDKSWTFESNRDFVIGAKLVADECRGVNELLDTIFDTEFERARTFFAL